MEVEMFRNLFDPNKTIKHVSYKEIRRQYKRHVQRSDRFFNILIKVSSLTGIVLVIVAVILSR